MMLVLIIGLVLCGLGLVLAFDEVLHGHTRRRATFRRAVSYTTVANAPTVVSATKAPSLVDVVVPALSRVTLKLSRHTQVNDVQLRLAAAGLGTRITAQQFLALETILGVFAVAVGFAIGGLSVHGLLIAIVLAIGSRMLPEFGLNRLSRDRADRVSAYLPGAIDQIAVSLEAGLGFDAAISYFVRRTDSPLAHELRVMLNEVQMGESRTEALRGLAERVPSDAMRSFVQSLVQSEGIGISRAEILRSQASELRNRWQASAEERAQKAPIKMLFPIVIFIVPVMFIVILGPAINQVSQIWNR